jgi:biopolymer transport protein ExbD
MSLFKKRSLVPPAHGINVTPLIDVLLVLLIIFMVIQPQKEAKLPVKAPAPLSDGPPLPETLMLTVSGNMLLELNSKPIELDELLALLRDLMEQRAVEARTLFIKAPPMLAYGPVVLLIDLAKGAGVVTIGLVQDEKQTPG